MCDKALDTCLFVLHSIPDWLKTQKVFLRYFYAKILIHMKIK